MPFSRLPWAHKFNGTVKGFIEAQLHTFEIKDNQVHVCCLSTVCCWTPQFRENYVTMYWLLCLCSHSPACAPPSLILKSLATTQPLEPVPRQLVLVVPTACHLTRLSMLTNCLCRWYATLDHKPIWVVKNRKKKMGSQQKAILATTIQMYNGSNRNTVLETDQYTYFESVQQTPPCEDWCCTTATIQQQLAVNLTCLKS